MTRSVSSWSRPSGAWRRERGSAGTGCVRVCVVTPVRLIDAWKSNPAFRPPLLCLLDASDAVLNCSTQNLEYWHVEAGSLEAQHTLHCKVRPVTLALGPFGRQACPGDRRPAGRLPDAVLRPGLAQVVEQDAEGLEVDVAPDGVVGRLVWREEDPAGHLRAGGEASSSSESGHRGEGTGLSWCRCGARHTPLVRRGTGRASRRGSRKRRAGRRGG